MADSSQLGYDSAKSHEAATNVGQGKEAVDSSSKGSQALSAAQLAAFWGNEDGPMALKNSTTDMFNEMAKILSKETSLIGEFETKVYDTMKRFEGTETDNEQLLLAVTQALNSVATSDAALSLKKTLEKSGFVTKTQQTEQSTSGSSGSTDSTAGQGAPQQQDQQPTV